MDIDIDVRPDTDVSKLFPTVVRASMVENGVLKPHIVGYYFQNVPVDKLTGLCAIPYENAEDFDLFKIDMLHLNILDLFENKQQIRKLLKRQPEWNLLDDPEVVAKLFHLGKHFDTVKRLKPRSIDDLADALAIIRPNKKHLIDKYVRDKSLVRMELYVKSDPSDLRKSHAIPYAMLIVLQLHLIKAGIL